MNVNLKTTIQRRKTIPLASRKHILNFLVFILLFQSQSGYAQLTISEACTKNNSVLEDFEGDYEDFIELQNASSTAISLLGYSIADGNESQQFWPFPDVLLGPYEFLIVFASGKSLNAPEFHTHFKLRSAGDVLYLMHNGQVDSFTIPTLRSDDSYGVETTSGELKYFDIPSPDAANNSESFNGYCEPPIVSVASGFYSSSQTIICSQNDAEIFFATAGNNPLEFGQLYNTPIVIDTTTTFRFVAKSSGLIPSEIITRTYFIEEEKYMPMLSITAEPNLLFDADTGLYMMGPNAELDWPFLGANFWNNKHIVAHIEYFENGISIFNQGCELRMHGGKAARTKPQHPLRLIAKKKYGVAYFNHDLIPLKPQKRYKKIVLRNGGSDWNNIHFTDGFIQQEILRSATDLDCKGSEPVVVFINGKYFGVHDFQEKIDEEFCRSNNNISSEHSVTLLEDEDIALLGNHIEFDAMVDFFEYTDLSIESNFELAAEMLDINSFVDYMIAELYWNNYDWPANNVKYYKSNAPNSKWRFILFDFDVSMNSVGFVNENSDNLERILNDFEDFKLVKLFVALLGNAELKRQFINRYADLVNTDYASEKLTQDFSKHIEYVESEMHHHFGRWGGSVDWWWYYWLTPKAFQYLQNRAPISLNQVQENFVLEGQYQLQLDVWPHNAGSIHLNTLSLHSFDWEGTYFKNVPIEILANSNFGFQFSHWEYDGNVAIAHENKSIQAAFLTDTKLTAVFKGGMGFDEIFIYPNPSNGEFSWSTFSINEEEALLLVFDLAGKTIHSEKINLLGGVNRFDGHTKFESGCYEIVLKTESETKQGRLMVE